MNTRRFPRFKLSITLQLIILNIILFILFEIYLVFNKNGLPYIALTPIDFIHGKYLWTLLTSMFMHANFFHLFVNMFSLFFIGTFVERIVGRKRFLWFYLIAGILAGIFFALLSVAFGTTVLGAKIFGAPDIPGVGASGAIFGLLGFLAVMTPSAKVYLIVGPLIAIVVEALLGNFVQSAPLLNLLTLAVDVYFIISLFAIFSFNPKIRALALPLELRFWLLPIIAIVPLIIIGLFVELPIGNMAHLGGLIAGLLYGVYIKKKYKKKSVMINRMFSK